MKNVINDAVVIHHVGRKLSVIRRMNIDIAIKDIETGEELTYDYALLHPKWVAPLKCNCGIKNCRKIIRRLPSNSPVVQRLRRLAKAAVKNTFKVKQPLLRTNNKALIRMIRKLQR